MKRQDYVSWDAYFMGVALLSAQRSKDNNTQVGSCIVNPHNKILSMGYNGMQRDVMMIECRGREKELLLIQSICMCVMRS